MNDKNVKRRVTSLIGGVAFAIVFAVFAFISCKYAVHSSETRSYPQNRINRDYGYDRAAFLNRMPWDNASYMLNSVPQDWYEDENGNYSYIVNSDIAQASAVSEPAAPSYAEPVPAAEPEVQSIVIEQPVVTEAPVDPNSPAGRAAALGLPAPPAIDINEWQYMLVSANSPLEPQDYEPPQLAYLNMTGDDTDVRTGYDGNRQVVDIRIGQSLADFAKACHDAGLPVYLSSGYRSYSEQMYLYDRKVNQGYSPEVAKTIVAYPGTSEHQTGLSCDITDRYRETKDSSLAETATYKWLCEHCQEYGFVVRYPEDKSGSADSITGVIYEPWHFRYVGTEAAAYMMANNLCLEEFVALYK